MNYQLIINFILQQINLYTRIKFFRHSCHFNQWIRETKSTDKVFKKEKRKQYRRMKLSINPKEIVGKDKKR